MELDRSVGTFRDDTPSFTLLFCCLRPLFGCVIAAFLSSSDITAFSSSFRHESFFTGRTWSSWELAERSDDMRSILIASSTRCLRVSVQVIFALDAVHLFTNFCSDKHHPSRRQHIVENTLAGSFVIKSWKITILITRWRWRSLQFFVNTGL